MQVTLTAADTVLRRYGNAIGVIGAGKAHKAFAHAINRTTSTVRTRAIRAIVRQSGIPRAQVVKAVKRKVVSTKAGPLVGEVTATGYPLSLKYFKPKQFSWGVRTKEGGKFVRYPGLFIYAGHYRSGIEVGNGHVFQNTRGYNSRAHRHNAIELMRGPSVPDELVKDESKRVFYDTVAEVLPRRVEHELSRMLPR